ncbi:MAG: hypothetical protein ACERKJ_10975 [Candidatus Dadabacteria bacterium]
MKCCNCCIHYQKVKGKKYNDCYMVMGELVPRFFDCISDLGYNFELPFDPHDAKYYTNSLTFKKLYNKLFSTPLSNVFEKEVVTELDIVFDTFGKQLLKGVKLLYIRPTVGYCCSYFKRKGD